VKAGRDPTPSGAGYPSEAGVMDSQSVKTTDRGGVRGYAVTACRDGDGFKKINGRKRQVLTDTTGLVLKAKVHAANLHDGAGARLLLPDLRRWYERLAVIWADQGYPGQELADWVAQQTGARLEIVRRTTKEAIRRRCGSRPWRRRASGCGKVPRRCLAGGGVGGHLTRPQHRQALRAPAAPLGSQVCERGHRADVLVAGTEPAAEQGL